MGSNGPTLFEGREQGLTLVAEAEARELLALSAGGLPSQLSPTNRVKLGGLLLQMLAVGHILLPPGGIGDTAPITQQIGVPVLATTHATILRLEAANAALHVVVGARKVLPVVALHQIGPQIGEYLQELGEALLLQLGKRAISQSCSHALPPAIQAASHRHIARHFSR